MEVGTKILIHGLVKQTQFCASFIALWSQNREISMTAKLLVFKSVFVPILSKEQTTEVGNLRRVLGVTLRDKKHRSEIRKALDVKSLLQIEKTQLC